jgi:hypothetical protein
MFEETLPPETLMGMGETSEVDPEHAPVEAEEAPKSSGESRSPMEEDEVTLSSLNQD